MVEVNPIGIVKNDIDNPTDPFKFKDVISTIVIDEQYKDGLLNLEKSEHVQVIYYFHKSPQPKKLVGTSYFGTKDGVFATRSPIRPGAVGLSTVKLIKIEGNKIIVKGLDAINGTPVLDIKPYVPSLDEADVERIQTRTDRLNPKREVWPFIRSGDYESLLHQAARLHGHYCEGLAMGVMMGARAMKLLGAYNRADGMENLLAIVEMNHCAVDGIQHVTGCTFGNNALIFQDLGKTALTLVTRGEDTCEGIRISLKPINWEDFSDNDEEINELFDKVVKRREGTPAEAKRLKELSIKSAINLVHRKFTELFDVKKVKIPAPAWAPIWENIKCSGCGELVIQSRVVSHNGKDFCYKCAGHSYYEVSGNGIYEID
ncbi:MAG: tRNA (N6-threonylcarbamoyladenosine(37)-N6)-methyltransferase TrmO [Promethearchaeota archaeon]